MKTTLRSLGVLFALALCPGPGLAASEYPLIAPPVPLLDKHIAIDRVDTATSLMPGEERVWRGVSYRRLYYSRDREAFGEHYIAAILESDPIKRIAEVDAEIAAFPHAISARYIRASSLQKLGRCQEALSTLDDLDEVALAAHQVVAEAKLKRAQCHYDLGELAKARATLDDFADFISDIGSGPREMGELRAKLDPTIPASNGAPQEKK